MHLVIPYAGASTPALREAARTLELPALRALLARLVPQPPDEGQPSDLAPAHERLLAREAGLWRGDGRTPWAAAALRQAGGDDGGAAWAWFTPCRWQVGRDRILMGDPQALALDEHDSRALLAAMTPYFAQDGLQVEWVDALTWHARGAMLADLRCASLDRVIGRTVDDWLPRDAASRPLRRLQQEMQMLLYTHAVNESREARGMATVNSFWVTGAGALEPGWTPPRATAQVDDRLRAPALAGDAGAWSAAWQALDRERLGPLVSALQRGDAVRLSLCGDNSARSWTVGDGGWTRRLLARIRPAAPAWQALELS